MADNKKLKGKPDRLRVAGGDNSELEYLHRQFPTLSHAQVKKIVKQKGPMRKNIKAALVIAANMAGKGLESPDCDREEKE